MKKGILFLLIDLLLLFISFYFFIFIKYNQLWNVPNVQRSVLYFLITWSIISFFTGKYNHKNYFPFKNVLATVAFSNLVILGFIVILIRISKPFESFRFIILYSIVFATAFEFFIGYLYTIINKALSASYFQDDGVPEKEFYQLAEVGLKSEPVIQVKREAEDHEILYQFLDLSKIIVEETNEETYRFISSYFSERISDTLIISTTTVFNLYNQPKSKHSVIINLKRINDIQYINKFFEAVNSKLNPGGLFIDWVETYGQRKSRILSKYPWGLNYIYYSFDFLIKRVFPKLNFTKKLYFFITHGQNRVLSKAETFGRLYSCGFEFIEEQFISNRLFFVFRKVKEPLFDYHPTYGPIIKLERIGKNGKIIGVFKFRTMHAYSEYLQNYIFDKHNLEEGGKFKNDFRVTTIGRIFRALWIDELPMLINVFIIRNMKIVGVRPLSKHYFSLYSEELKQKRIKFKPGLIPPYYAQYPTPKTLEEIQENEMKYLHEHEKNALTTDIKYFFKAFYNIIFHKARSR